MKPGDELFYQFSFSTLTSQNLGAVEGSVCRVHPPPPPLTLDPPMTGMMVLKAKVSTLITCNVLFDEVVEIIAFHT